MTQHRFSQPLCAQHHAQIEANSPASTTHGLTLGLFIPTLCVTPTATYSARAA